MGRLQVHWQIRKGSGMGVLWHNFTSVPMAGTCGEHILVSGSIVNILVLVGVMYVVAGRGQCDGNDKA